MNIRRTSLLHGAATLILGASALLPMTGTAHADTATTELLGPNLVANGGFEEGADPGVKLPLTAGTPFLTGWTVVGSEAWYVGTRWKAEEGTRSLALADPNSTPGGTVAGGVTQKIATTAGQRYRVVFYQAADPTFAAPSTIHCVIGGTAHDYTYQDTPLSHDYQKMSWVQRSFVFTASGSQTSVAFYAWYTPGNMALGLDNVQIRAIQSPAGSGVPGTGQAATTSLHLGSVSVASGGQQTLSISAGKGAALGLIVDYPDGTQLVVPAHAGADGHYTYTWTIPTAVHGTVHVLVDSAGSIAQASFTVA